MPARALGLPVLYVETRSPLATDDGAGLGTRAGYWWLRTDTGQWWVCRDAANGSAVWDQMQSGVALAALYQPLEPTLTALASLTGAADRLPFFNGVDTAALATFTAFGRSLVDDADAVAARATIGAPAAQFPDTTQLVVNPDFSFSTVAAYPGTASNEGWTNVVPTALAATDALVPAGAPAPYVGNISTGTITRDAYNNGARAFAVEPLEWIYYDFWACAGTGTNASFQLALRIGGSSGFAQLTLATVIVATVTWTRFIGRVEIPATVLGAATERAYIYVRVNSNAAPAGGWFFTKVFVRRATEVSAGKLILTQNSNYQITPQDSGKVFRATSGAPTYTLPAHADVDPFFAVTAKARGTTITVARAGTNTVDGGTTVSITTGLSRTFGRADTAGEMESY